MHTFKAEDSFEITGRGRVYTGPAPFTFERNKSMDAFAGLWKIDHPDTAGKVYRVTGVESYCIPTISEGQAIGILVEEVAKED